MPHAWNPTQVVSSSTVERVDASQDPSALSVCCRPAPRLASPSAPVVTDITSTARTHHLVSGGEVEVEGEEEDVKKMKKMKQKMKQKRRRRKDLSI